MHAISHLDKKWTQSGIHSVEMEAMKGLNTVASAVCVGLLLHYYGLRTLLDEINDCAYRGVPRQGRIRLSKVRHFHTELQTHLSKLQ
jgi:hypothetical protein